MQARRIRSEHGPASISLQTFLCYLVSLIVVLNACGALTRVRGQTSEERVVAQVNGRSITQKELDASIGSQLLPLQRQIYAIRQAGLENLILRAILEDEAKKRGISVELLRSELAAGKVEVLMSQVEQAYLENANAFGAMNPDEAKERLRLDLESQARMKNYREALSKLVSAARVERRLEEPKAPSGVAFDGPSIGAREASVVITEFSDFQCPYCKEAQSALKQILQSYPKDVRLVFKNLPLTIHPEAFAAAQAAVCAGEQGAFWQFHDALFASERLSSEKFSELATGLTLNVPKFKACMESETARLTVLKDIHDAQRLGISGTPAFVINGRLFQGVLSFETLKEIIERERQTVRR